MDLDIKGTNDDAQPLLVNVPRKTWVDRFQALFEVILLSGLFSSLLAALPFALHSGTRANLLTDIRILSGHILLEALITFVMLYLIMRAHGENLRGLGLRFDRWRSQVLVGLWVVPALFVTNIIIAAIFQAFFPEYFLDRNPLTDLIRKPQDLILFIIAALVAGGIKEEVQRAFVLNRFREYLGGAWLGLILWSVVFSLGHYIQGVQGMVAAGLFGLIFGIIYLARGLLAPIVAHSCYDTLALLGYWFFLSHK